ncbi:MAG: peptidylprolyl isomerase [Calditrichaeota bacterium]|nr:MAG: peptidylprolyl isomerase [Calditrichota bacterium]
MEWRASHILVKDRKLAEELMKRLKRGANFSALAKEYSTCPSKSKGGDLGWFGPGKMVKEFEQAVSSAPNRLIPRVIRTQFGYHIIRKTGQR